MQSIEDLFKKYYLEYTSYVIKYRAIPYIEDGFKPVQRRIIHTLLEVDDGSMHKVAFIVGQTMKYHPHGDGSIYEALVNLEHAKYFIKGGGNFGDILTGTSAAAARYIECKILPFAKEVLFSPEITQYVPTYDSRNKEPVVFPSKLPVVLFQGEKGIAPGMTSQILPHNPHEVIDAMKKAMDGEFFEIYPDLPTGGFIDVDDYNDGKGTISIRSKVDIDEKNRKLIIRQIPFTITTESLINDIDQEAKKGKLKIASITDYTSDEVNIELEIAKGVDNLQVELDSLYAYTNAEIKIRDLSPLVIKDKHPVVMGISEIIKFHASYLQEILKKELNVEKGHLIDKLQVRTLERIFIEERIYKKIEPLKVEEEIYSTITDSLMEFKDEFVKELDRKEIDHLLKLPIRRISLFDIEKNKKEIDEIKKDIKLNDSRQKNIKDYAKFTLDRLEKILPVGSERKSVIAKFSTVDVKDVIKKDLMLRYDKQTGYLGYGLKSGDEQFLVSSIDKVLIVLKDGTYYVTQVQDKYFAGKKVAYILSAEKENLKKTVFTLIFKNKIDRIIMIKRCSVLQYTLNKPYSMIPEGDFDVKCISIAEEALLTIEYKSGRNKIEQVYFSDYLVKGVNSLGVQLTRREVKDIKLKKIQKDEKVVKKEPDLFT